MLTPLRAEALRKRVDPELFSFETTAELPPLAGPFAQERALRAVEFGLEMESPGYNVFVVGPTGAGKRELALSALERSARPRQAPGDLVYVYNFEEPERPLGLTLPAGGGRALRAGMDAFVAALERDPSEAGALLQELMEEHRDRPELLRYLRAVAGDLPAAGSEPALAGSVLRYRVNVLVDNEGLAGAPIVFEPNPTYENLLGRIGRRAEYGALVTDFTLLEAGAVHRASGGYLVLEAHSLLGSPAAYEGLKRVLREGRLALEDPTDGTRLPATGLRPQPVDAHVKVVLLGTPWTYYVFHQYDEDFPKLFKIKGELGEDTALVEGAALEYARLAARVCADESLLPLHRDAVAGIVEYGLRAAEHQQRLATGRTELGDLVREAHAWARREGAEVVRAPHVSRAIQERIHRNNELEEFFGRLIAEGTVLIDTEGSAVGQANGLWIFDQGDYAFGKPCRVTAKIFLGKEGVINIEREADMGGRIHNKGVLILQGFFGSRYAQKFPIAFAATLCFEQSYGGVEGDSASSAELFALVSALAELPIRQDIAVTGSVNQMGQIQSVGGINLKVEGFFKTCKERGLTGTQGVIIPRSNVQNLMLDQEVIEAVERGLFHVYAMSTADEGLEILTGLPAGAVNGYGDYPEGTINAKVMRRVERLTRQWKKLHQEE